MSREENVKLITKELFLMNKANLIDEILEILDRHLEIDEYAEQFRLFDD
tara:strand:+ start:162 stop:308 length:147 start_codon:yes stop_codon:yes gene_type:complete